MAKRGFYGPMTNKVNFFLFIGLKQVVEVRALADIWLNVTKLASKAEPHGPLVTTLTKKFYMNRKTFRLWNWLAWQDMGDCCAETLFCCICIP